MLFLFIHFEFLKILITRPNLVKTTISVNSKNKTVDLPKLMLIDELDFKMQQSKELVFQMFVKIETIKNLKNVRRERILENVNFNRFRIMKREFEKVYLNTENGIGIIYFTQLYWREIHSKNISLEELRSRNQIIESFVERSYCIERCIDQFCYGENAAETCKLSEYKKKKIFQKKFDDYISSISEKSKISYEKIHVNLANEFFKLLLDRMKMIYYYAITSDDPGQMSNYKLEQEVNPPRRFFFNTMNLETITPVEILNSHLFNVNNSNNEISQIQADKASNEQNIQSSSENRDVIQNEMPNNWNIIANFVNFMVFEIVNSLIEKCNQTIGYLKNIFLGIRNTFGNIDENDIAVQQPDSETANANSNHSVNDRISMDNLVNNYSDERIRNNEKKVFCNSESKKRHSNRKYLLFLILSSLNILLYLCNIIYTIFIILKK